LADLERIGPQYYLDINKIPVERRWLHKYLAVPSEASFAPKALKSMFFSPGYSLWEQFISFDSGTMHSLHQLWPEILQTDLRSLGTEFQVPFFVFQGAQDYQTPTAITGTYFASIHAPQKEIVLIQGGGHLVSLVMPDRILAELVKRVRPLTLASGDARVP
jgi:pimeloyl-ACP methyl ester carboxylesterase